MAQEGTSSRYTRILKVGFKSCLILSTAALLLAYRDISVKELAIAEHINILNLELPEHQTVAIRSKRSFGFDDAFGNLHKRLDFLEKGYVDFQQVICCKSQLILASEEFLNLFFHPI